MENWGIENFSNLFMVSGLDGVRGGKKFVFNLFFKLRNNN